MQKELLVCYCQFCLFFQNTFKGTSSRDGLIPVGSPLDGNFKKALNEVIELLDKRNRLFSAKRISVIKLFQSFRRIRSHNDKA